MKKDGFVLYRNYDNPTQTMEYVVYSPIIDYREVAEKFKQEFNIDVEVDITYKPAILIFNKKETK